MLYLSIFSKTVNLSKVDAVIHIILGFMTGGLSIILLSFRAVTHIIKKWSFKVFLPAGGNEINEVLQLGRKIVSDLGFSPEWSSRIIGGGVILWGSNHFSYNARIQPLIFKYNKVR